MNSIMLYSNSYSVTSLFSSWISFISIFWLYVLARISNILLNKSGQCGYFCLAFDLRGNGFSFLSLSMLLVGLTYMLCYIEVLSPYPFCWEFFINITMLNFVKSFLCIYWDDHKYLFFNLLISCFKLIGLLVLNHPCIHGINLTYSWCMILLICCWILIFVYIFLWISASICHQGYRLVVYFFCDIFF